MYKYVKRIFDIVFSLVGLILLSPVFLIIALFIKMDSKGPVIFKQKRIGKDEKKFFIYKFRTMKMNSPSLPPYKFKNTKKYLTRVGGGLRRSSLDELPQLVNVFKGEMSLIGPRPGAANNEEELRLARRENEVFNVQPGVTGYAQINGRDELAHNVKEKVKHDKYYVENCSFWLDFSILVKTVIAVIAKKGYNEGLVSGIGVDEPIKQIGNHEN